MSWSLPGQGARWRGRHRRRWWAGPDRAHIEVRGLDGDLGTVVAAKVSADLRRGRGVRWVDLEPALGRVVVAFDADTTTVGELVETIERSERAAGVADAAFPAERPEHPADGQVASRHKIAIAANGFGFGLGVFGRVLRSTPLPVELASVFSFLDNEPRLRLVLESYLGTSATDLGLAIGNAVAQGMSQGPLGLVADSAHRANLLLEAAARREVFLAAEANRWGPGPRNEPADIDEHLLSDPPPRGERLPDGPVERYADRAAIASVVSAVGTLAATASPRRAAGMLLAGLPKASRMGRDAFVAHLTRSLASRDVLVLNDRAMRHLDRVDAIVVDAALVHTGRSVVTAVRPIDEVDTGTVHRALSRLFEGEAVPASTAEVSAVARRAGSWELGPLDAAERRRPKVRRLAGPPGRATLALREKGRLVAVVGVDDEISAAAGHLVRSARRQGHLVALAGGDRRLVERLGAHLLLDEGNRPALGVRALQADGCVVAVVAAGGRRWSASLRAADVGVEVAGLDGSSWSGDVVLNDTGDALYLLDAVGSAREVSRQGVALAVSGSALGGLVALGSQPASAARSATRAVNVAALVAMANGIRAAHAVHRHGGHIPAQPTPWHAMEAGDVLRRLGSGTDGLTEEKAQELGQTTVAAGPTPRRLWASVAAELVNPLTPVLAGGATASAAVGSLTDAAMVAGVTVLNALIGGVQRFSAERAIRDLSEVSAHPVNVVRGGQHGQVPSDALVVGDVVLLAAGDAVPADCRLLDAENLEVDESALTGESDPVAKHPGPSFSSVLAERSCMLYEGTTVAAGEATAVVVAVGYDSEATRMGAELSEGTVSQGVEGRLRQLTGVTLPVSAAGGALMLASGLLRRQPMNQSVASAVALVVAAVPEGLPLLATMAQLASARRLSDRGALTRNPRAVEALGRVRVVCTDKTGTLTEGRIRLVNVSDGDTEAGVDGLDGRHLAVLAAALRASPEGSPDAVLPHLTDQAVVEGAARARVGVADDRPGWERTSELPFEATRGYHAVTGRSDAGAELALKGAPEVVLPRCRAWQSPRGPVSLDDETTDSLTTHLEGLASRGLRVLAVAHRPIEDPPDGPPADEDVDDLTLLGFLALSDPVRPTAAEAVRGLRRAGVEIVMVTGDHPITARGIANQLGILNGRRVLTGDDLAAMSDASLDGLVADVSVFARVTPADKVRIVASLQRAGQAVAMTGDGANDAPAIRLADVGIALGSRCTPSARRAADLVVTDDRIETIVDAIVEGRAMWSSVREALAILLGGNLGEVGFTVLTTLLTGTTPLSARQLLAVNLLTDVAPALAIAVRPPPRRTPEQLLEEGPDASLGRSLEQAIVLRAATTASGAALAWVGGRLTGGPRRASTMALVALVGSQLGQTVAGGGLDPMVVAAGAGSALVLAAIVQTPGLSQFFGCTPLDPAAWAIASGSACAATAASVIGSRLLRGGGHVPGRAEQPAQEGGIAGP